MTGQHNTKSAFHITWVAGIMPFIRMEKTGRREDLQRKKIHGFSYDMLKQEGWSTS